MQKRLLFLPIFLLLSVAMFAQSSIQLNINHKLGDEVFEMDMGAINNINHDFKVTRLEYYISTLSIIHDGGNETLIEDLYILVDTNEPTQVDLGMHDITSVEGVKFHIGVDEAHNHLDPSAYSPSHPLAPKSPSMHWGWASGYRFIAIEGQGGSNYNQSFQLHGLEDDNYFSTAITLPSAISGNAIAINIDADYTRVLEDVEVNSGVIVHGGYGEALHALENLRDFVFSPSTVVLSTDNLSKVSGFDVYPNPAQKGEASFLISNDNKDTYQVLVTDILGRKIQVFDAVNGNEEVNLNLQNAGLYLICLQKDGKTIITRKLLID